VSALPPTGLALVPVIGGLALALAPSRIEVALARPAAIGRERRRQPGLAALAAGVALLWLSRQFGH